MNVLPIRSYLLTETLKSGGTPERFLGGWMWVLKVGNPLLQINYSYFYLQARFWLDFKSFSPWWRIVVYEVI